MLVCVWVDMKWPQHKPKQFRIVVELSVSKKVPDTDKIHPAGYSGIGRLCRVFDKWPMSHATGVVSHPSWNLLWQNLTETKMDLWIHTLASAAFVPLSSAVSLQYGVVAA